MTESSNHIKLEYASIIKYGVDLEVTITDPECDERMFEEEFVASVYRDAVQSWIINGPQGDDNTVVIYFGVEVPVPDGDIPNLAAPNNWTSDAEGYRDFYEDQPFAATYGYAYCHIEEEFE